MKNLKEQCKNELRNAFESVDAGLWTYLSTIILSSAKEVCTEYYNKGFEYNLSLFRKMLMEIELRLDE